MDGYTAINFCKTCQIWFCPSWRCLCCMMAFAGAFTTKQQLMHPHCFVYYDKTWMKTVLTCFTKIIAELQPSLTQYERPMYHYERKQNMLSSTDNNFMICLFDFERFSIESRFPFFFTHTVCIQCIAIVIHAASRSCVRYSDKLPMKMTCNCWNNSLWNHLSAKPG